MKHIMISFVSFIAIFLFVSTSCNSKGNKPIALIATDTVLRKPSLPFIPIQFDSTLIAPFFVHYPKLSYLKSEVVQLYKKNHYQHIWYDSKGVNEFAYLLQNKINNLEQEGIESPVPYKDKITSIFQDSDNLGKPEVEVELFLSSMYFYYADKVFKGLDAKKSAELGWYLPRKKQSYTNRLDSLLQNPTLINKPEKDILDQYYKLKDALQKYRNIQKNGGWDSIILPQKFKSLKPGDTSRVILQIRKRLFITNELTSDSKNNLYDSELLAGILNYKKHNGYSADSLILPIHIREMDISINERIKAIMVNMERCRWISPDLTRSKTFVVINIPSYKLTFFRNNKPELISKVVVGKAMNKTVVFSSEMNQVIFCPYWNVPPSILRKEILPAIAKNKNYLAQNDMEWHNNGVRQRPGAKNALGKIKFVFPNSNNIYLHDTPSKNLFKKDRRAFSHGCIRVARPRDLAISVLKDEPNWTLEKIDTEMNRGSQRAYNLKHKIPVYIGYFTAWVGSDGVINFYDDVYKRDARLSELLLSN